MDCWNCAKRLDAADNYCRYCGSGQGVFVVWYLKPLWIVLLTLFALGPFNLGSIWKTPAWGRNAKIAATVLTLAYTAWLGLATIRMIHSAMGLVDMQMQQATQFQQMGSGINGLKLP